MALLLGRGKRIDMAWNDDENFEDEPEEETQQKEDEQPNEEEI